MPLMARDLLHSFTTASVSIVRDEPQVTILQVFADELSTEKLR